MKRYNNLDIIYWVSSCNIRYPISRKSFHIPYFIMIGFLIIINTQTVQRVLGTGTPSFHSHSRLFYVMVGGWLVHTTKVIFKISHRSSNITTLSHTEVGGIPRHDLNKITIISIRHSISICLSITARSHIHWLPKVP